MTPQRWGLFALVSILLGAALSPFASVLARMLHRNMGEWADVVAGDEDDP